MIEPVYPFQCRELDGLEIPPRATTTNHFSLVEPDDRLGEGVESPTASRADVRDRTRVAPPAPGPPVSTSFGLPMDPILPRNGASRNPGAVQYAWLRPLAIRDSLTP